MSWLSWLKPQEKEILNMLETQAANLLRASELLFDLISEYENVSKKGSDIKDLEHNGDIIAHNIFNTLDKTFITPFDREDISRLAASIDNVLDAADGAADRFVLFKIKKPTPYMGELANYIKLSATEIHGLVSKLLDMKNGVNIINHCRNISRHEHDADQVYRKAVAELFETGDPIEIIKMKEVYDSLEEATDKCVDVADVIEDVVLKYK
ncbi:MAG: DUF47 domain-containing protein [Nitrososphaerales archaeon]